VISQEAFFIPYYLIIKVKSFVCIAIVVWGLAMLYGQNLTLLRVNY